MPTGRPYRHEIVAPIDGLEAATGVKGLIDWIRSETDQTYTSERRPNMLMAMVKYQEDTKNIGETNPAFKLRNAVYRALKDSLGE